jgi:hypothetical protein
VPDILVRNIEEVIAERIKGDRARARVVDQ